jgi:fatty acid desaturase
MTGRDHDNLHTAIADGQASVAFVTAAPGLSEKAMERPLTRNDVVSRAKALKNSAALAPIFEILAQWLQILCGLALYYAYPFWWVYIPVVLFVSARQYALAVMLHDAQHTLLHSDKTINQYLGKWLVAAPLGAMFVESQKNHLEHHANFGSQERDPDYALYCFGDPMQKQSISQLARLLGGNFVGEKIFLLLRRVMAELGFMTPLGGERAAVPDERSLPSSLIDIVCRLWAPIFVQAVFFAGLTFIFGWYGYFALWLLPLVTLVAFYNELRIFCEHSLIGRDSNNPDERMVTFISNPVERFFIAPNHMNYHAEHHFFPYVPHRNLPALREAIRKCPEWSDRIEWRSSYFGHLRAYIRGFKQAYVESALSDGGKKAESDTAA